jgi:hypothetical protein
MNKVLEALKKILPAEHVQEVATAVEAMIAEAEAKIEAKKEKEFNAKLLEAYDKVSAELQEAEATAETGYKQAFAHIQELTLRLERQQEEFDNLMDEGFSEAYEMLEKEQAKNNNLEVEMYEEFNNRLKRMKDMFVEKFDQFSQIQYAEIYEAARRDIMNDPRMVEHKVALDKIIDIVGNYVSEEDFAGVNSTKVNEAFKAVEDLKGQVRVLEARNVRLSTQNNKLNEQVREMNNMLTESTKVEKQERKRVAGTASGRGSKVLGGKEQIIAEYHNPQAQQQDDDGQSLVENNAALEDLLALAGLTEQK